jgi:hypothetical protein
LEKTKEPLWWTNEQHVTMDSYHSPWYGLDLSEVTVILDIIYSIVPHRDYIEMIIILRIPKWKSKN